MPTDWRTNSKHAHLSEHERRLNGIKYLFAAWGLDDPTPMQVRVYYEQTQHIPFYFFRAAVSAVIQSHKWAKPPTIAELVEAAKDIAGMRRERYHAGQYLPPECEWPADGQRYAINSGEFEPARGASLAVGPGAVPLKIAANVESDESHTGGMF